ncbi:MAG: response regulator transcription factor [Clostridia bacterium]|jgi:two-component system response regulator VicR|nr:response regulator transcription factor [Clostridia bacterium]
MADKGKKTILVVEDEKSIAQILAFNLMQAGYAYEIAFDGEEGLNKALAGDFDLILLDIMLPKMDGFEVCRRVRERLATPIIMVTARQDEIDKIFGLDVGADDYVTKPFKIKELLARIKANIRRSKNELVTDPTFDNGVITIRNLVIDNSSYTVTRDDEQVSLTKKEYELLYFLASNKGKIFTREQILENVWGYDSYLGDLQNVDVTVSRLRKKLEKDTANPEYFFTKRNAGYYVK